MSSTDWNELDGYEALVSELRATAPAAPESLRQRVLAGGPAARPRMSKRRRLPLVVVPVAVVLAVGAALVHGVVNSGQTQKGSNAAPLAGRVALGIAHGASAAGTGTELAPAGKPAQRKLGPLTTSNSYSLAQTQSSAWNSVYASGSTPHALPGAPESAVSIPRNRLVHAVASLEVRVPSRKELSARTNRASQIVGSFGGYAQSVRYQNSRNGYGESVLDLRVPVQKATAALLKLATLGTVVSQQLSTEDLQSKLNHEKSGIGSLQRAIAVYESALNSGTLSGSQRVIIQIRLNNARRQLSHLRHARTGTLASGATADISLLLTTRSHAVVGHRHHKQGRLGRLLGSAGNFLGLEGIIVLYALIVLSPIVLLAALVWWVLRERRRREDRLLASA